MLAWWRLRSRWRLRIADVARVTGEIDARIEGHHRASGCAYETICAITVFKYLLCQSNIFFCKLLQTQRLQLSSKCPTSAGQRMLAGTDRFWDSSIPPAVTAESRDEPQAARKSNEFQHFSRFSRLARHFAYLCSPVLSGSSEAPLMVDIARPSQAKKKRIRRILYVTAAVIVVAGISLGVSRLKPAAPTVDRAVVWIDAVKKGSMLRQVRGSGTLVPEDIRWITTQTSGPRRAHRPPPRRAGHARHRHPRADEPAARAVGPRRGARLPVGAGGIHQPQGGAPERLLSQEANVAQHRVAVQAGGRSTSQANETLYKEKPHLAADAEAEAEPRGGPEEPARRSRSAGWRSPARASTRSWRRRKRTSTSARRPGICAARARRPQGQGGHVGHRCSRSRSSAASRSARAPTWRASPTRAT